MLLSVVIPVYNSERTIEPLVKQVLYTLADINVEIILVNDGSLDKSESVCNALAQSFHQVKFVSLRRNFGEFNAVICGLNYAEGDYTVIIDDDFQNPPSEILKLLKTALNNNFDVVYSYYDQKQHSAFRNVGSWAVNKMTTWLLNKPSDLYLSSFKLIKKEVVKEIIKYTGPYPYIDGLIFRVTQNVGCELVTHKKREHNTSNYTISKLVSLFFTILFSYSYRPLRILTLLGFFLIGISMIFSGIEFFSSVLTLHLPNTDHVVWLSFVMLSGIQLSGMGLLGEYIGKSFMTQGGQPQYVVKFHTHQPADYILQD